VTDDEKLKKADEALDALLGLAGKAKVTDDPMRIASVMLDKQRSDLTSDLLHGVVAALKTKGLLTVEEIEAGVAAARQERQDAERNMFGELRKKLGSTVDQSLVGIIEKLTGGTR
jgi:hypothetical protein